MIVARWIIVGVVLVGSSALAAGGPDCWNVDDVRAGMVGEGRTVIRGTAPEVFGVEIIGVLRRVQPGRDLVIARFNGLGLERSGVMAGMSGSPVSIEGKLLGAVAYTWEFGLEPIGAITPFSQMRDFAGLAERVAFQPSRADEARGRLLPIRSPIAVQAMSPTAVSMLADELEPWGMVPVQGGAANDDIEREHGAVPFTGGSSMGVGLVLGDLSVTAVGTVTAVVDQQVYGFGHPFMDLGICDLPLLSAYIHTVMPMRSASFKIGSTMKEVGAIRRDVSTGVVGVLGESAPMIPVTIHAHTNGASRTFRCRVARLPVLSHALTASSIVSCLEGSGQAPAEMTVRVRGEIQVADRPVLDWQDSLSGQPYRGPAGLVQAVGPLAEILEQLSTNPFAPAPIESVECWVEMIPERRSAEIVEIDDRPAEWLAGESAIVRVALQPYRSDKGDRRWIDLSVPIPPSLAPGEYTVTVKSAVDDMRWDLDRRPWVREPRSLDQLFRRLTTHAKARSTTLALRLETKSPHLSQPETDWPELPPGVAAVLSSATDTQVQAIPGSILVFQDVDWSLAGTVQSTIRVVKHRQRIEFDRAAEPRGAIQP